MKKILVLGGNFAGATAALELVRKLRKARVEHEVTVISPTPNFLYVPSLIWVPFGKRSVEDIRFDIQPLFARKGVRFIQDKVKDILPQNNRVLTEKGETYTYDYVVIATGVKPVFEGIPGFDKGYAQCIVTPDMALRTKVAFDKLVENPGPVVVGAVQGASCMGAAYEFLFNMDRELRKRKIRKKVDLTWITPEPELGHFGIGGITGGRKMLEIFMKLYHIHWKTDTSVKEVQPSKLILQDGTELPYKMAMLIPPFAGADGVRGNTELCDAKGFITCDDAYRHVKYQNVFAAGLAVSVPSPFANCKTPFGVPKTGFPSEVQAKVSANNIVNHIQGSSKVETMPFGKIPGICIMDAGEKEVIILTNHLFRPRQFEVMIPNLIYNFGKVLLEKYMLFKNKMGWSYLP